MGETPTGELLKVAIAHQVDRDAEKPLYRVSSREGMKVLYTAVVSCCTWDQKDTCNLPIRSPFCLCYLKSYSVTCGQKSSSQHRKNINPLLL